MLTYWHSFLPTQYIHLGNFTSEKNVFATLNENFTLPIVGRTLCSQKSPIFILFFNRAHKCF